MGLTDRVAIGNAPLTRNDDAVQEALSLDAGESKTGGGLWIMSARWTLWRILGWSLFTAWIGAKVLMVWLA